MAVSSGYAASNCWRNSSALISAVPMTFACWAQFSAVATGSQQHLIDVLNSASATGINCWEMHAGSGSANLNAKTGAGAANSTATTTVTLRPHRPVHACAVFTSATDRRIYQDGGNDVVQTTSRVPSGVNRTAIGLEDNAANANGLTWTRPYAPAYIFWPAAWNIALGRKDVAALARGTPPWLVRPEALVFCLEDFAGGLWLDRSRNRNHFTKVGTLYTLPDPPFVRSLRFKDRSFAGWVPNAYSLAAAAASFALSGQTASLKFDRKVAAAAGSFALSGKDAALSLGKIMAAATGSFTLTGQDAGLRIARFLVGGAGSFTLTGRDANLLAARLLQASTGAFTFTGKDAGLVYTPVGSYTLTADAGAFSLSGKAANLLVGWLLSAGSGAFVLDGKTVALTYSGAEAVASEIIRRRRRRR